MPTSIDEMVRRMHTYRDQIESEVIGSLDDELARIFQTAERRLAARKGLFKRFALSSNGHIEKTVENVEMAGEVLRDLRKDVDKWIIGPGKQWVNGSVPKIHAAGRELARINLDVSFLSPELVRSAFQNVSVAERSVLKVGYQDLYKITGTVGDDVAEWFRQELTTAVIEGIPVQSRTGGDSLESRLIKSGRIRPIKIRAKTGRIIHQSLQQRSQWIARVESARIVNRTHETLASDVLGASAVYINSNPRDSRTTDVCLRASRRKAMTLSQWDESDLGRPPRSSHLCRSVLIGGRPDWFEGRMAA